MLSAGEETFGEQKAYLVASMEDLERLRLQLGPLKVTF